MFRRAGKSDDRRRRVLNDELATASEQDSTSARRSSRGRAKAGSNYSDAADLDQLREKTRLLRVTSGGLRESHPHDVTITREAPNYHT